LVALTALALGCAAVVAAVAIPLTGARVGKGGGDDEPVASATATAGHSAHAAARRHAIRVRVYPDEVVGQSLLNLGVTLTQHTLDPWGDPEAVARGQQLLRFAGYSNQHIYGWGANNPEPSPGVFDWRSLDRRMQTLRSIGGKPIITLCCAPDWMTSRGSNTSDFPNLPPTRDHYDDFAALAKKIAERYPDVRRFMVWNEMKGFWDRSTHNWDYRAYTELYNRVYRALKSVNPANKVGGPYLVIEGTGAGHAAEDRSRATADPITDRDWEVIDYWLQHKKGADFIAIDRKLQSRHDTNRYSRDQLLSFTSWFERITQEIRRRTDLAVVYAEDYFADDPNRRFQAAGMAAMLAAEVRGGAAISLRWGPQATRGERSVGNGQSLFTDTRAPGGGRPLLAWHVYDDVATAFSRGTHLVRAESSSPKVEVLASPRRALLINRTGRVLDVRVQKRTKLRLAPWAVRLVAVR
jgi:hypothetical protein